MLIDAREIDEIRSQLGARAVALISELKGAAPNKSLCSRKEMRWGSKGSFAIAIGGERAGRWHDFESGEGGDLFDLIKIERGVNFAEAVAWARGWLGLSTSVVVDEVPRRRPVPQPHAPDTRSRNLAREILFEAGDPRRTLGEHYLKIERRLGDILDDTLAQTLRFHPRCPFKDDDKLVRAPALVCALRDPRAAMHACSHLDEMDEIERRFLAEPANIVAIQRIRLDDKGRKVERRSLGALGNGVVFISSIFESFYSATATVAEGIESALAARKLGFTGVVAITGVARLRTFEPPFIWGSITGLAENDAASESTWRAAAPRWREAGHRVRLVAPPSGDANDYVRVAAHHGG